MYISLSVVVWAEPLKSFDKMSGAYSHKFAFPSIAILPPFAESHVYVKQQCFFRDRSYDYNDELGWGAIWLYRATGDSLYLNYADEFYSGHAAWSVSWDDKTAGTQVKSPPNRGGSRGGSQGSRDPPPLIYKCPFRNLENIILCI